MYIEISSETHHSVNTDDNHDTSDEDPRPARRRKLRSAPAVTAPLHLRRSPRLGSPSTTRHEIDEAQPQDDYECSSTFVDDEQRCASRTSPSPPTTAEAVPFAEYQEWPFQGFLKRTKIGDDISYNLEFKLPSISGHLHLPINPKALDIDHNTVAHSQIHQAPLRVEKRSVKRKSTSTATCHRVPSATLQAKRTRVPWTEEEETTLLQMRNDGRPWEEISAALPGRSIGTIRVRCSTKFKR